ncbi:hypothetical protein PF005_g24031 [Phytophthora fragariae]|uniref:MULE transposase domain-containing protein n=1 Tax=Phytophthora fragariae TaxID=53985 RepID=A0A6A3WXP5_9STRA|nr:hypothetical protein PF003_g3538 [Phytophthora fragariae]KAE8934095.1 hypothetical protein PF009_g15927 [Phytophthora fragariae]KAE9098754.1 hypothetical protein PF007_g16144 [Phytophthora fragariae]KAE9143697.1 hypothetical protein PF006_g11292 [Phytophthora fragariae]KAE9178569.1 hypothetical protein PF005_g24031 [Phytophthora fragariae]
MNIIAIGINKTQVQGRFYRTKLKNFGNDVFVKIKSEHLCSVRENSDFKFFQYHGSYYEGDVLHHLVLWGHPALLDRLRARQTSIFVDGTFRSVPANFNQLVIVMVFDAISNLYIPSCYALTTGKTTKVYDYVMYHTNTAVDFTMDPAYISCDFEQAITSAVKHQFPRSKVIGCLFHFKKALRRKMLKEGISENEVGIAMQDGAIDELTTVRPSEIIRSGIRNVKTTIMEECQDQNIPYSTEKWSKFWKYFVRTWIKKYKPEDWNVYGVQDIVNRTNNPLERYNRTLNRAMGEPHPDIGKFVVVLEAEAQRYVDSLADVANRRVRTHRRVRPRLSSYVIEAAEDSPCEDEEVASDSSLSPEY